MMHFNIFLKNEDIDGGFSQGTGDEAAHASAKDDVVDGAPEHPRQADWNKMTSYLDAMSSYVPVKPVEVKGVGGWPYKLGFGLYVVIAVLAFVIYPFWRFVTLDSGVVVAFLLTAAIFACSKPFSMMMYDALWCRGELADSRHEREVKRAEEENRRNAPPEHDDGDNELDEIRSIARAVGNIGKWNGQAAGTAASGHAEDMLSFANTVMSYVLLSYWDGHEKRLPLGFSETIMRTSAAWQAYVELVVTGMSDKEAEIAEAHIGKVISQGKKSAWRNFNRVDARVHGESHVFDLPDAPRPLTNLEKLSVAAEMAEDAE